MAVRHGAVPSCSPPSARRTASASWRTRTTSRDYLRLGEAAIEDPAPFPARAVDTRVTDDGVGEETFVQPSWCPRPRRYYFKFGALYTGGLRETGFADDDEAVQAMYDGVKADVEEGIDWLLRRRRDDLLDIQTGTLRGGGKPAGTFYADENVETRA